MQVSKELLTSLFNNSELIKDWREKKELTLDSTFYSNVDPCNVKALFGGVAKMQPTGGALALVFGGAFHVGLETHYAGATHDESVAAALSDWDSHSHNVTSDTRRSRETLDVLMTSYLHWERLTGDILTPVTLTDTRVANEIPFKIHLGTTADEYKLFWKGKIDMVVKLSDGYWAVDHKTTSVMGEQFLADKHRSNQMVGYTFACRHLLGVPVRGILLNVAALRSKGVEFARFKLPISEHAVYEWASEVDHKLEELHKMLLRLDGSPEPEHFISVNREACCTKYGLCTFFDVCQALPQHREALLCHSGKYAASTFDPLKS